MRLGTLVLLEVVLGVDNLVFISILVERLPAGLKRQAFLTGLGLALAMRLVLLAGIAWIIGLTAPLFTLFGHSFSARDIILIGGGIFLLCKGTLELHERLEGQIREQDGTSRHESFWQVILQIIVLDAVFSLDSIITSVGMVDHVSIMMLAVISAMLVMALAAGPLLRFVERHPSVIVLCLGFLLMIGLGLLTDGLGYHIPKGYLYAAIIFAVLVEACNQWALCNRRKRISMRDMRESTARVVLGLLGRTGNADAQLDAAALPVEEGGELFAPEERAMVARVIRLSGRTARFIMVPRQRIRWLDSETGQKDVCQAAANSNLPWLPVLRRETDEVLGVVRVGELLQAMSAADKAQWNLAAHVRPAPNIFEHTPLADILDDYRAEPAPLYFVQDEYGGVVGMITQRELLSVLAGQMGDVPCGPDACRQPDGSWRLPGRLSLDTVSSWLGIDSQRSDSATLAGLVLEYLGHIPVTGERLRLQGWEMEITRMDSRRIDEIRAVPLKERSSP
ncbi:MAG: tellurium resistance protein TerC [Desulfovibrio sp.]|nr:tellurium resistance protein TerC [Desulfovibrio sp.]